MALLGGCGKREAAPKVVLSDTQDPAPAGAVASPPLRFALSALVSPRKAFDDYRTLLALVGRRVGRPVEVVSRATYAETMTLLENQEVDAAFMCAGPYVESREKFGAQILAVPVVRGKTTDRSCIIVHRDSPIRRFDELKGKTFAFTDQDSNSGKLYPAYLLATKGSSPKAFFSRTLYSHGHDNSVKAVAARLVDGAAVHCNVLDDIRQDSPEIALQTRTIWTSPPFPTPPFVVHPGMEPGIKERLRKVFLSLHRDEEGLAALRRLRMDRFTVLEDPEYDCIRRMRAALSKR